MDIPAGPPKSGCPELPSQCSLTFCSWIWAFTTLYSAEGGFWLEMSSSVSASQLSSGSRASWNFPQCNRASCSWATRWATCTPKTTTTPLQCQGLAPEPQLPACDPLLPPDPRKSRDSPSPCSHLLVEGVPAGVDFFHVMLQPLDITVFPGALDESLTNSIDLL